MKYLVIVALLIAVVRPAHAYIDGGSGSYMVQIAMAGVVAFAFSVKLAWFRIKAATTRLFTGRRQTNINSGK